MHFFKDAIRRTHWKTDYHIGYLKRVFFQWDTNKLILHWDVFNLPGYPQVFVFDVTVVAAQAAPQWREWFVVHHLNHRGLTPAQRYGTISNFCGNRSELENRRPCYYSQAQKKGTISCKWFIHLGAFRDLAYLQAWDIHFGHSATDLENISLWIKLNRFLSRRSLISHTCWICRWLSSRPWLESVVTVAKNPSGLPKASFARNAFTFIGCPFILRLYAVRHLLSTFSRILCQSLSVIRKRCMRWPTDAQNYIVSTFSVTNVYHTIFIFLRWLRSNSFFRLSYTRRVITYTECHRFLGGPIVFFHACQCQKD